MKERFDIDKENFKCYENGKIIQIWREHKSGEKHVLNPQTVIKFVEF